MVAAFLLAHFTYITNARMAELDSAMMYHDDEMARLLLDHFTALVSCESDALHEGGILHRLFEANELSRVIAVLGVPTPIATTMHGVATERELAYIRLFRPVESVVSPVLEQSIIRVMYDWQRLAGSTKVQACPIHHHAQLSNRCMVRAMERWMEELVVGDTRTTAVVIRVFETAGLIHLLTAGLFWKELVKQQWENDLSIASAEGLCHIKKHLLDKLGLLNVSSE